MVLFQSVTSHQNWNCRYHYNVADSRLTQHVEKGNEDGLYISSVASCTNLWALIMDAGTGFTAQVYELSHVFLHKVCTVLTQSYCMLDSLSWSSVCSLSLRVAF
jgi:hypothetical protein